MAKHQRTNAPSTDRHASTSKDAKYTGAPRIKGTSEKYNVRSDLNDDCPNTNCSKRKNHSGECG